MTDDPLVSAWLDGGEAAAAAVPAAIREGVARVAAADHGAPGGVPSGRVNCEPTDPLEKAFLAGGMPGVDRLKSEWNARDPFHCTDLGNAKRLVERHGHDIRYCHDWRDWLVYDGARWAVDRSGEIERRAKDTAGAIYLEPYMMSEGPERKTAGAWAVKTESESRLRAMVALAQSEPNVPVAVAEMDADPMLLNVANGTLDLTTGALRPHNRQDLLTKLTPVAYDPAAECPLLVACLTRWLAGDDASIAFLQRAIGYTLTGRTDEQVLLFLYGLGANGKSVLLELLARLLGEYGVKADFNTFLAGRREGPRNDLAALVGARFVAAAEADEGRRWDESTIKAVTGGDTVTARKLYAEFFSFRPTFKPWFSANTKPLVSGTGEAMWRRIRLVPFTVTIPEGERDPHLLERLTTELPGVLTWAVQGCLAWQQHGLGQSPAVREATATYRAESDVLGGFLEQECQLTPEGRCPSAWLHKRYKEWAERAGERAVSQVKFSLRLAERGFHRVKDRTGRMVWFGISLDGGTEGCRGDFRLSSHEGETVEDYGNGGLKALNPPSLPGLDDAEFERRAIEGEAA